MRDLMWKVVDAVHDGGEHTATALAVRVREALRARGLDVDCYVGRKDMTADETVDWYAGQFLSICDGRAWFAMNSWVNCAEKFLGPRAGGGGGE